MNRKLAPALCGALLVAGTLTAQAAEVSGNVALTTDYRFRGISQNTGELSPALQGGFDVATDSGLYIGTWGSNVNFSDGALELDIYGGWTGSIADGVDLDLGLLYYSYPKDGPGIDLDYLEVYGSLAFMGATLGVNYSDDYFAETGKFWYLYGDYSLPLAENYSLDLHVGYNAFDEKAERDTAGDCVGTGFLCGEDNYLDYSVGVSTSFYDLDWSLSYVGVDIGQKECFGAKDICDDTVVLSVSKSL
ncbi:MAG: TorF family putative porin [Pseudomonadales bacterium]